MMYNLKENKQEIFWKKSKKEKRNGSLFLLKDCPKIREKKDRPKITGGNYV